MKAATSGSSNSQTEAAPKRGKVIKLPKSLGQCADLLYTTREARLKLQKQVDAMQDTETALQEHFIKELSKSSTGIAGRKARVQIVPEVVPTPENWDKLYTHIRKTGNFELMQKRLNTTAIKERWENKKEVPGVTRFHYKKVSCTLLKTK